MIRKAENQNLIMIKGLLSKACCQRLAVKEWSKEHPKNLKKVVALVKENYGIYVSKYTIQRILHSFGFSWRRVRKKPKGEPDSKEYKQKKEALEQYQQQAENGV